MWRFFPGCEPPPIKKTRNNEDGPESNRNYEKSQKVANISKQLDKYLVDRLVHKYQ